MATKVRVATARARVRITMARERSTMDVAAMAKEKTTMVVRTTERVVTKTETPKRIKSKKTLKSSSLRSSDLKLRSKCQTSFSRPRRSQKRS